MTDLTRRTVLGGLAVGSMAALTAEGSAAATLQGALPRQVDVVVVGSGISGLVAAGRSPAAAARCWWSRPASGSVAGCSTTSSRGLGESRPAAPSSVPPRTTSSAWPTSSACRRSTSTPTGNSVYVSSTLGRLEYQGTVRPTRRSCPTHALLLQQRTPGRPRPRRRPWTHPRAAEWDAMTLGEYIRRNAVNAEGIGNLIRVLDQPGFGADPDQLSLLFVIHYMACSGNEQNVGTFERNSDTVNGAQERRFVGGSQRIPLRLAHRLGDRVALAARVSRIDQGDGHAVVHTSRGRVRCRAGDRGRAAPAGPRHRLVPPAAGRRRQLLRHMDMGELMKCDAVYETPFWRADGLNGFGLNDSGAVRVSFDNCPRDGDPGVLLAFVGGTTWRRVRHAVRKARRRKAVLEGFAALFGDKALKPIEYTEHDWTRERWTRGGPVAGDGPADADVVRQRRSGGRTAGCTGPAPRRPPTGPATWTARSAPASVPPPRPSPTSNPPTRPFLRPDPSVLARRPVRSCAPNRAFLRADRAVLARRSVRSCLPRCHFLRHDRRMRLIELSHPVEHGMTRTPDCRGPRSPTTCRTTTRTRVYAAGHEFHIGRITMVSQHRHLPRHAVPPATRRSRPRRARPWSASRCVPALVVDGTGVIGAGLLDGLEVAGHAVLFRTGWDRHWRTERYGDADHPFARQATRRSGSSTAAPPSSASTRSTSTTPAPASGRCTPRCSAAGIPIVEHLTGLDALPRRRAVHRHPGRGARDGHVPGPGLRQPGLTDRR